MKVLIVGGGGREHALAWKCAQAQGVERVFVAPGNGGTATEPGLSNVPIDAMDFDALTGFARDEGIGLTLIGPEDPLVAGITDRFRQQGLPCFGPSRAAARIEGSKVFTKDFLERHAIPTAAYATFEDADEAVAYVRERGAPIVVKPDGLTAGKGVVVARTLDEAEESVRALLSGESFGRAGNRVVVEEFLDGEEASFIVITDGENIVPFASSQDHKARDEGDVGPNTGGMGAYSPAPVVSEAVYDRIMAEVMEPTVRGMTQEGSPYRGFLYAGLMIMPDGTPRVIEFNCRFGDPEAQPVLLRLRSDLVQLCMRALEDGGLEGVRLDWDPRVAVGVVMASGGYPLSYRKGDPIDGLAAVASDERVKVFHAGTRLDDGKVLTDGGRVLCVTALGEDVLEARDAAYASVDRIHWRDVYFRRDIAHRALARAS